MTKSWKTSKSTVIYRLLAKRVNVYLVVHEKGAFLVDSGMNRTHQKLIARIGNILPDQNPVDYILLTHAHFDHCQAAKALSESLKARLVIQSSEAYNLMSGYTPLPSATMFLSKVVLSLGKTVAPGIARFAPAEPDILINEEGRLFNCSNLKIIHTPGHTSGSVSLIVDEEIALVGDTLFGIFPGRAMPPFADNVEELFQSWALLLDTPCHTFLPGHGRPVSRKTLEKEYFRRSI
ncbi:MAG: MBL fold metallo-hydrolase [Bacteroidales bacterium]|nr:MBL fold metallo-hydrolase [Bacteroidales bacterium]